MKTPLFNEHLKLGAKIVPFAGWEMPLQYRGIAQEVEVVRKKAGLFDVSHMGRISIHGENTLPFLDYLSTNKISRKPPGTAVYTIFCNEAGCSLDDLLVYIVAQDEAFIVVNASNREADLAHLNRYAKEFDVRVQDHFETDGILSLQGPLSAEYAPYPSLKRMHFMKKDSLIISRTGYTGEEGFEFYGPHNEISKLWHHFLSMGIEPCGLGARDVLRLEMGYALYGHELSLTRSPLESVAAWAVKMEGHDFLGKGSLKQEYYPIALVGEKIPAREGYPIFYQDKEIGKITSGTFSPTLQRPIALGLVPYGAYERVDILIRGNYHPFHAVKLPFIPK